MLAVGPRTRALFAAGLVAVAAIAIVGVNAFGFSSGVSEKVDKEGGGTVTLLDGGCSCHNPELTGGVQAILEGVPSFYTNLKGDAVEAGPYNLTVRIVGGPDPSGSNQGGFNLQASAGTFAVPAGKDDVQVLDGEATHTSKGNDQRNWSVQWAPPAAAGSDVVFTLTVNSVNGNGANDPDDLWGRASVISLGKPGHLALAGGGGEAPGSEIEEISKLGVNYYAYWVGVVSFIALFIVLAATFFVLRYGESKHWTDWRDRPVKEIKPKEGEAPRKAPVGTWVVLGVVVVIFLLAAVQVVKVL